MNHPSAYEQARENLRLAHDRGVIDLADILVQMITPAGALSQWRSDTIESVLAGADRAVAEAGLPSFGNADDVEAHRYWAAVADDLGMFHDYEED